jgi:hypothetical protein
MTIWFIFHHLGMFHQEKSGNPGMQGEASLEWKKCWFINMTPSIVHYCANARIGGGRGSFAFV